MLPESQSLVLRSDQHLLRAGALVLCAGFIVLRPDDIVRSALKRTRAGSGSRTVRRNAGPAVAGMLRMP